MGTIDERDKKMHFLFLLSLFIIFFQIFFQSTSLCAESKAKSLKINIFSSCNGKGLQVDKEILQEALSEMGHSVVYINYGEPISKQKADINLFIEHPLIDKLSWAPINWLIPNPEWYTQDLKLLDKMDLILCKTRESVNIFSSRGYPTYYLGFTSPDCYDPLIEKDYSCFLHLAGGSDQKGTNSVLRVWKSNCPHLTVVKREMDWIISQRNLTFITRYVPQKELRQIQNRCGIHLCPSETEGFGHYIMEAMSAKAVIVTTNAPPMNENILDHRCLVRFFKSTPQRLATNYYVDPAELKNAIDGLLTLSPEELREIGERNRKVYLRTRDEFWQRLRYLLFKTIKSH